MAAGGAAVRWGGFQNVIHVMSTRIQAGFEADGGDAADAVADGADSGWSGGGPVAGEG